MEELGVDGEMILKLILQEIGWKGWTGLIWVRKGTRRASVNTVVNLWVLYNMVSS
jgi:hypothetical protein